MCSDETPVCNIIFGFPITTLVFNDYPVGECIEGNCLKIAEKASSIKNGALDNYGTVDESETEVTV